ncbi:unnamed protein product [Linum trigynum]|uniref:Glutamate receptor n=1 Tax=Linum trigynum TaxID=586398 RepID=A0AAV2ESP8_9ROSI
MAAANLHELLFIIIFILPSLFLVSSNGQTRIGVVLDLGTRIGMEQKTAMEIAGREFNISLHFRDCSSSLAAGRSLLRAAAAAEELIRDEAANAIVMGTDSWEETALVADVAGNGARIPVVSFAAAPPGDSRSSRLSSFLVRMGHGNTQQMRCVAALAKSYNWRRVVAVYQENAFGTDSSGELTLLSDALHEVGAEIEHRILLPLFLPSNSSNAVVQDELIKVIDSVQSRVFIVLRSSLPVAVDLFREAKKLGLVGMDTAWILTARVAEYLDSIDPSVLYSIEGALGIKPHRTESSTSFREFKAQFGRRFRLNYPDDHYTEPSFHALQAHDGISMIGRALEKKTASHNKLLENIMESKFTGLTGRIEFRDGGLVSPEENAPRIVNVVGNGYKKLDFCGPPEMASGKLKLGGPVTWPGDLNRDPKGWGMPTDAKPMTIGVPGRTTFEKFVQVVNASDGEKKYEGFCIELFWKILDKLDYRLPYIFVPYNGTYEELVDHVYNKTYDAIVGDITILADRWEKVEFTQPFAESGLSMIVPADSKKSAWMFMKPFTMEMWLVTGSILMYTAFIIWFLEHQSNPEFKGPLMNQMGTAILFTFSSLFFAHREKVYSNLTRLVLVVWLFVVLILNSSYTASLTSMLTVQRLKPNVTDIDWLKKNNLRVGCDGDSFVRNYLEKVLEFKAGNIENVNNEYNYETQFDKNQISAAFLELPYQKVFINHYCKRFTATAQTFRFGGLGFVFQKGSPIAADVSKAILKLSEEGELKRLEEDWFSPSRECSGSRSDDNTESLSLQNFWGLYVLSGATSTVCLVVFLLHLLRKYRVCQEEEGHGDLSIWNKTAELAKYLYRGKAVVESAPPPTSADAGEDWSVSSCICESPPPRTPDDPGIPESFHDNPDEIRIPAIELAQAVRHANM